MYLLSFYISIFISVTHETLLKNLPTSDDIRNAKINYHRQTVCMIKVGKELCYSSSKSPADPEEIAKLIRIIKDESLSSEDVLNDDTDNHNDNSDKKFNDEETSNDDIDTVNFNASNDAIEGDNVQTELNHDGYERDDENGNGDENVDEKEVSTDANDGNNDGNEGLLGQHYADVTESDENNNDETIDQEEK